MHFPLFVSPGSVETLFRRGVKINELLIAQSPSNAFAKNYENEIMLAQDKMLGMLLSTEFFCDTSV